MLLLAVSLDAGPQAGARLAVTVRDENGVLVVAARVTLIGDRSEIVTQGETDHAGRREFAGLPPIAYHLRVEKAGFYVLEVTDVRPADTQQVEVILNHIQEYREEVEVTASPPAMDPAKTTSSEELRAREILKVPYPTPRDIRRALPLLPGILPGLGGQVSVQGAGADQNQVQFDGFNVTHPATGFYTMRVSADAVRAIEVLGSRYPVEQGRAAGGVIALETAIGDDRLRFSATDFIPSVQNRKGFHLDNWTPRATFSGPLRRGRAWFTNAFDGEYGLDIVEELPEGADRSTTWRISNLSKVQVNLSPSHVLTGGFLVNRLRASHAGLTPFDPEETTLRLDQSAWLLNLRQQSYLSRGTLLEFGWALGEFSDSARPLGVRPFKIHPGRTGGNFYRTTASRAARMQWFASATLPAALWRGRHEVKLGFDVERVRYRQFDDRRAVNFFRADGTRLREISFFGAALPRANRTLASAYVQDRWSPGEAWLLELGLRFDHDTVYDRVALSPRLAATYSLRRGDAPRRSLRDVKFVAGAGLFTDATNLEFVTRAQTGQRFDQLYAANGVAPAGAPRETFFLAEPARLDVPQTFHWSVGLEQRLPGDFDLRLEFLQKHGRHGLAYFPLPGGVHELRNGRRDRYDAFHVAVRRAVRGNYFFFASYTRSRARSNAVLDFSLDRMVFSPQTGGRLPWDVPNRLLVWGWLPLVWKLDLGYSLDWRTGYPFDVVNDERSLVGEPNSRRLPDTFSLNAHFERRFRFARAQWALRAGFDNLTNRRNPTSVDNNVDSPTFLTFGGRQSRAFTGRIRFLGRK